MEPEEKQHQIERQRGKWGAYCFALLCSFLLLAFSFQRTEQGHWQPKENPPLLVWALLMPTIGGCLGVQIDPAVLARFLGLNK